MASISNTDLILNPDGSVYHLNLKPGDIAGTIILVGDPGRVQQVSSHFDIIEFQRVNREFVTHTGSFRGMRLTVLSTGIGTDNIDIVMNELDALVNVDLEDRTLLPGHRRLALIRLGTSGALHADIPPGAQIVTAMAGGLDGLYHFYQDTKGVAVPGITEAFMGYTGWPVQHSAPYFIEGSGWLLELLSDTADFSGITLSTPGFYAPQVRSIRLEPFDQKLIQKIGSFTFNQMRINNFEMESSALYALSALLDHDAITICVAVANRINEAFLKDYHPPVDRLIEAVLGKLAQNDRASA